MRFDVPPTAGSLFLRDRPTEAMWSAEQPLPFVLAWYNERLIDGISNPITEFGKQVVVLDL